MNFSFGLRSQSVFALGLFLAVGVSGASARAAAPVCKYPNEAIEVPDQPHKGKIALTFDDGPNPDTTPHVLDILKKYNIKATFFLIGSNIIDSRDAVQLVRRELREGHNIGNHTWDHPHMRTVTDAQMRSEILKTDRILARFPKNRARVMRFPFGESDCRAESFVESLNYNIVGWDVDSCDWSYGEGLAKSDCVPKEHQAEFGANYQGWIDYQLAKTGGGIILMHDAEEYEAQHLEAEILHLKAQGYEFVELDKGGLYPNLLKNKTGWEPAPIAPPPPPALIMHANLFKLQLDQ